MRGNIESIVFFNYEDEFWNEYFLTDQDRSDNFGGGGRGGKNILSKYIYFDMNIQLKLYHGRVRFDFIAGIRIKQKQWHYYDADPDASLSRTPGPATGDERGRVIFAFIAGIRIKQQQWHNHDADPDASLSRTPGPALYWWRKGRSWITIIWIVNPCNHKNHYNLSTIS